MRDFQRDCFIFKVKILKEVRLSESLLIQWPERFTKYWCQVPSMRTVFSLLYRIDELAVYHPRRLRGSQLGQEKRRDKSFQVLAREPLGTDPHRAISKISSGCLLLIGHEKCFVLFCPIGEQFLLSYFREFIHGGYCFYHGLSGSCTKEVHAVRKLSVWY